MEQKTLKDLEYDKILNMLAEHARNEKTQNEILAYRPMSDFSVVQQQLWETDAAMTMVLQYGSPEIVTVSDMEGALKRMDIGGSLSMSELLNVATVLRGARMLKKYYEGKENILSGYFAQLEPEKRIEERITTSILSEEEMADGASGELYNIRRKMRGAEAKVRESLNSMVHSNHYQKFLQDSIITMRNGRYVVPVKAEHRGDVQGIVHDISSSGGTVFIEPAAVVNANNEMHELAIKEQREIERILFELTAEAAEISEIIASDFRIILKLDFIFAKAKFALRLKAVCPKLNSDGRLHIKNGRHPLIESEKVVPSNIILGGEFDSLIITGPNTGGKTVALKTTGLFCLMTQSGFLIPASDGTEMPVFENIFSDIGDEQSIEQSLSTFSSHMKNIVYIAERITPNSLVLFDELGAGTDPVEGAALATAILEYMRQVGAKSMATTHYSELKLYALSTERVENASCEFDVNTLSPTYRLIIGIPGKSNAFAISQRLGLPEHIIEHSRRLLSEENIKFEDALSGIEQSRLATEHAQREQERMRLEIERLREELKREKEKLERRKARILEQAQERAEVILQKAKEETEEMLTSLKAAQQQAEAQEIRRAMEEVKKELNLKIKNNRKPTQQPKRKRSELTVNNLRLGASVLIEDMNDKGTVASINKKDETAVIQVGIMKITSKISNLSLLQEEAPKHPANLPRRNGGGGLKSAAVKPEVDLRGMNLEEALLETEKFLDQCVMAGLHTVTVIHGKGTGILRSGIQDLLRHHPQVKSYRLGKYGEGENGVTIAELK